MESELWLNWGTPRLNFYSHLTLTHSHTPYNGNPYFYKKRKSNLEESISQWKFQNIHWRKWCWSWSSNILVTWCKEQTHWKILMLGEKEGRRRSGQQRMRWLDGITNSMDMNLGNVGDSEQGSLECCSPRGHKQSDITEQQHKMMGFLGGSDGKESTCNAGNTSSIPILGRFPREGNGNPLLHSCLDNPMSRGAWWATVHGVTKNWTWLSMQHSLTIQDETGPWGMVAHGCRPYMPPPPHPKSWK